MWTNVSPVPVPRDNHSWQAIRLRLRFAGTTRMLRPWTEGSLRAQEHDSAIGAQITSLNWQPQTSKHAGGTVTAANSTADANSAARFKPEMDRWDHASLLPAASSPAKALEERSIGASEFDPSEPGSPLADGWGLLDAQTFRTQLKPAIKHSGWLLKASGGGPQRQWRRRYVYVLADRLCYTPDPGAGEASPVRYLPMDRIPVRALPRGYGPKLGVTVVEDRQVGD